MNPILNAMELELGSRVMAGLMLERSSPATAVLNRYRSAHPPIIEHVEAASLNYRNRKNGAGRYVDEVIRVNNDLYWCERISKKGNLVCTSLEEPTAGQTRIFTRDKVQSVITSGVDNGNWQYWQEGGEY